MMHQSSSRNQRSKGIKTKSIMQMCLLAAVGFWLIYQLKHTYNKNRVLDDRSSRKLNDVVDSQAEFSKLGRKDLLHQLTYSARDGNNKDGENEEVEEDDELELRREMEALEREQVVDDEIDEQDHERDEEQEDQDMTNDEAESGDEDKDDQVEDVQVLDDQDHVKDSSHEAREESYTKDDASSAVHRENLLEAKEDGNGETNDANAVTTEGKGIGREDMSISKKDGSKGINGSGVDTKAHNDTLSNNMGITGTLFQKRENEEIQELNATASLVSKNQEKLHVDSSAEIRSNQTASALANLSNLSDGVNSRALVHNQNAKSSLTENNNVVSEIGDKENNRPKIDSVAKVQADGSNRTMEQQNSNNNSVPSLAIRETEPNNPRKPAGLSQQVTSEEGMVGGVNLSSLPNSIQTGVAGTRHDSTRSGN